MARLMPNENTTATDKAGSCCSEGNISNGVKCRLGKCRLYGTIERHCLTEQSPRRRSVKVTHTIHTPSHVKANGCQVL